MNHAASSSGETGLAEGAGRTKLLTFQSWVLRAGWYNYALEHPSLVPFPLTDRSPCQDPFFDPFAEPGDRRPVISGLCRGIKNFNAGDRYIYITRVGPGVTRRLGLDGVTGPAYLAVAAMRVERVWESHQEAAADFTPRRYVASPAPTPYPPNLAFSGHPVAAAARTCCITFDQDDRPHMPADADERMWRRHYLGYRHRQVSKHLRAAECRFETAGSRQCLQLMPAQAAIVTPDWWGGAKLNVQGVSLPESRWQRFRDAIAAGREATS